MRKVLLFANTYGVKRDNMNGVELSFKRFTKTPSILRIAYHLRKNNIETKQIHNFVSFDDDELDIYGQFFDFDFSPNSLDVLSLEQYKKYKSKFNLPIIFYKNNVDFSSLNKEEYFANARLSDLLLVFKNKNFINIWDYFDQYL